ncbi:YopT-type cysteine protease domain-containing protein [Vibrio harveyi]|nr:YopT-type cysteine protease domain-containing protein [Vibrio harveyi]EKO3834324.1 YopT-type cysteine protease domain-containing protein [Vibrio harveyi]
MQGVTNVSPISRPIISTPVTQAQNQGQLGGLSVSTQTPSDAIRNMMLERLNNVAAANPAPISSLSLKSATPEQSAEPSSRLQNFKTAVQTLGDRILHALVSTKTASLRNSVAKHNGEVTMQLSQVTGSIKNAILKDTNTSGGCCEALSAHWMKARAEGSNLGEQLFQSGTASDKGKLNKETMQSVAQLQTDGMLGNHQETITEGWLRSNNIESPYRELGSLSRVSGQTSRGKNGAAELAAKIVDNGPKTSLFKKIGLEGPSNAHAVAAAVDGDNVTFFDPNFGEFSFSSKEDFTNWFTQDFWHKSGYDLPKFGLSGEFSIVNLEANH